MSPQEWVALVRSYGESPDALSGALEALDIAPDSPIKQRLREALFREWPVRHAWPLFGGAKLYVIAAPRRGLKIGVSADPAKRIGALQTANPQPLVLVYESRPFVRRTAFLIEERAHAILDASRLQSEWFSCSVEGAIAAIREAAVVTL